MSSYMDEYGTVDGRREKLRNRIILGLLVIAIAGGGFYYKFRNFREDGQVNAFVQYLKDKQYKQAYALWGCTDSTPCPNYPMKSFLRDWGPEGDHPLIDSMKLGTKRSCTTGIIQTMDYPKDEVLLWVNRADLTLSFAPWKVCSPKVNVGSLR